MRNIVFVRVHPASFTLMIGTVLAMSNTVSTLFHVVLSQQPVKLPIDFERNKADANVCLDSVVVEVEYRKDLQLRLCNP